MILLMYRQILRRCQIKILDYKQGLIVSLARMPRSYVKGLTPKQKIVLEFIEHYQMKNGASPTVREMRDFMKLKSDGFVVYCTTQLVKKGYLKQEFGVRRGTPRGIKLMDSVQERLDSPVIKIPVLGTVPAGGPQGREQYAEDWFSFGEGQIKNPENSFMLRVHGDSMIDAGIFEGDFVIVSASKKAKPGNIVVALVDGGSTVKRYIVEHGKPCLHAENPNYKNIYPESEMQIQGVVIGLLRWY